ncbi:uncharacterized protein LOC142229414 [Haematobia irritans]|uniref:uncharacterized protein LOC142229414 n=1 Tax=Haematobia irritans TaxID=7368 RepID=UPI003F50599F
MACSSKKGLCLQHHSVIKRCDCSNSLQHNTLRDHGIGDFTTCTPRAMKCTKSGHKIYLPMDNYKKDVCPKHIHQSPQGCNTQETEYEKSSLAESMIGDTSIETEDECNAMEEYTPNNPFTEAAEDDSSSNENQTPVNQSKSSELVTVYKNALSSEGNILKKSISNSNCLENEILSDSNTALLNGNSHNNGRRIIYFEMQEEQAEEMFQLPFNDQQSKHTTAKRENQRRLTHLKKYKQTDDSTHAKENISETLLSKNQLHTITHGSEIFHSTINCPSCGSLLIYAPKISITPPQFHDSNLKRQNSKLLVKTMDRKICYGLRFVFNAITFLIIFFTISTTFYKIDIYSYIQRLMISTWHPEEKTFREKFFQFWKNLYEYIF